jgi:predicted Zn-dependent protease
VKRLACVCLALAAALAAGCPRPTGPARWAGLAPEQEADIGRAAAPEFEKRFGGRIEHPALQAYVRTIGERIARSLAAGHWPYRFSAVESPRAAIRSLPGGTFYVTRGLLEKLETEGELAAVLAHQLAHSAAGHDEREIGRRLDPQVLAGAAMAAARSAGGPVQPADAENLAKVIAAYAEMQYTPEMEAEADGLALDYMVAAGYHPGEMVRLATLLETTAGADGGPWLAGHPNPPDRVGEVRIAVARKYPDRGGRVGRQEYQREVLGRLAAAPQAPAAGGR